MSNPLSGAVSPSGDGDEGSTSGEAPSPWRDDPITDGAEGGATGVTDPTGELLRSSRAGTGAGEGVWLPLALGGGTGVGIDRVGAGAGAGVGLGARRCGTGPPNEKSRSESGPTALPKSPPCRVDGIATNPPELEGAGVGAGVAPGIEMGSGIWEPMSCASESCAPAGTAERATADRPARRVETRFMTGAALTLKRRSCQQGERLACVDQNQFDG